MQSSQNGGGNGMGATSFQDMQRLQQQLSQFQSRQAGGQQAQQSLSGMGNQHNMQAAQQQFPGMNAQLAALQQQQQQQNRNNPGMNWNPALAMMQQQQANPASDSGQMALNNNMLQNWGGLQANGQGGLQMMTGTSSMDASSGSSARLMAIAGMSGGSMGGKTGGLDGSSAMQNMQVLLQQKQQQQQLSHGNGLQGRLNAQQQQLQQPSMGANNSSNQQQLFQRQLASLQMAQKQNQQDGNMGMMQGNQFSGAGMNLMTPQQQQLFQQMQQNKAATSNNHGMMQQMVNNQDLSGSVHSQGSSNAGGQSVMGGLGMLNEQQLRLQQQNALRSGDSHSQSMGMGGANSSMQMGSSSNPMQANQQGMQGTNEMGRSMQMNQQQQQMGWQQQSGGNLMNDNSMHSQRSSRTQSDQQSFLDGDFAGGWQSNNDLADRRTVIFKILEAIQQMRPDAKMSSKLPYMAKNLEEHLYRSAKTKEEYMNFSTLRSRLQAIAHGLEVRRGSSSSPGMKGSSTSLSSQGSMLGGQANNANNNFGSGENAVFNNNGMSMNSDANSVASAGTQDRTDSMNFMAQMRNNNGMDNSQQSSSSFLQRNLSMSSHHGNVNNMNQPMLSQQQSGLSGTNNGMGQQQDTSWSSSTLPMDGNSSLSMSQGSSMMSQRLNQFQQGMGNNNGNGLQNQQLGNDMSSQISLSGSNAEFGNSSTGNQSSQVGGMSNTGIKSGQSARHADPSSQKRKVILQQQQRLLLLRHASKCTAGPNCTTKFCAQMVTLWNHMKTCRDRECKTPHCGSSRCVLNHYRICKANGRTLSCEVCGPVMLKIKQQEREDVPSTDPLAKESDSGDQMLQQQQQQIQQQQLQGQQMQDQQQKLEKQLDNLRQFQRQQQELLQQQRTLEEQASLITDSNSQEAQHIQQQQILLQQLQKRCQQQQILLQQEVQMQIEMQKLQGSGNSNSVQQSSVLPGSMQPNTLSAQIMSLQQAQNRVGGGIVPAGLTSSSSVGGKSQGEAKRGSKSDVKGKRAGVKQRRGGKSLGIAATLSSDRLDDSNAPFDAAAAANTQSAPLSSMSMPSKPALQGLESDSIYSSLPREELEKHLASLNKKFRLSSRTITHKCLPLIQELIDDQFGWVFVDAVDPVALGLPDYFDVIKNPMHLKLVKKKLENAIYSEMDAFARDTRLVFENAILYNGEESEVGGLAHVMLDKFSKSYQAVMKDIASSQMNLENNGELCTLCGTKTKTFIPTVLYCRGRCGMRPIERNTRYYTDRAKQNHWCESCYEILKDEEGIILDDGSEIKKSELEAFDNNAQPEESWVKCDECQSAVHNICALYNGRKSNGRYTCPNCYLKKPPSSIITGKNRLDRAEDLPHCNMSKAIEDGLYKALNTAYHKRANDSGVGIEGVERANNLVVRVVSNLNKKHRVGDQMSMCYSPKGFPVEFTSRSKCIALFQKIHGVDTLLFAMFVYEYGQHCPSPNRRRVYISYLDSVKYFEPKFYRTTAYQAILVEYLRYVKDRGFHTAHIWSCPPTPGDDYIFFSHPPHQLFPREDMLRAWYHQVLDKAKSEGIVLRTTNLYDEYFAKDSVGTMRWPSFDLTSIPYFEGDYIPGEIENIIKQEGGQVSSGTDMAGGDNVMERLGQNLAKMKENFIVVHLLSRRFAAAVDRGEDVSSWVDDCDEGIMSKRAKISGKDSSVLHGLDKGQGLKIDGDKLSQYAQGTQFSSCSDEAFITSADQDNDEDDLNNDSSFDPLPLDSAASAQSDSALKDTTETLEEDTDSTIIGDDNEASGLANSRVSHNTGGDLQKAKRRFDSLSADMPTGFGISKNSVLPIADTSDSDEPFECEIFESRQQFLNFCLKNHNQFDELRRAKHSTLMVLYQLHNPLAPKFPQQNESESSDSMPSKQERNTILKAHVALVEHAANCQSHADCTKQNCQRMKQLIEHSKNCEIRPRTACKICTRLLALSTIHSRVCSQVNGCRVPFCQQKQERLRRLEKQQQQMDDRRRQAQNELYHAGV